MILWMDVNDCIASCQSSVKLLSVGCLSISWNFEFATSLNLGCSFLSEILTNGFLTLHWQGVMYTVVIRQFGDDEFVTIVLICPAYTAGKDRIHTIKWVFQQCVSVHGTTKPHFWTSVRSIHAAAALLTFIFSICNGAVVQYGQIFTPMFLIIAVNQDKVPMFNQTKVTTPWSDNYSV